MINILHVFMILLFVGWGIFLVYCLIKFRARPGHKAVRNERHFKVPTYLEIGVAVFEVCILIFLSYPIWAKSKNPPPDAENAMVVRVVGEQFAWSFHYPGKDGVFGRTAAEFIDAESNPVGVDRDDPSGKDDIVSIGEFFFPVNKPVIAHVTSKDVIHSFWIPVLRVKHDAIPGSEFPVWFEATQTGDFDITCAQLCGVGHTRMRATASIRTQEEFDAWMEERIQELE